MMRPRFPRLGHAAILLSSAYLLAHASEDSSFETDQFDDAHGSEQNALTSDEMRQMHKFFDLNKDGKVSLDEVMRYSEKMKTHIARKDVQVLMQDLDKDSSGTLSMEEVEKDFEQWGRTSDETPEQTQSRMDIERRKFTTADRNANGQLDLTELPSLFYPEIDQDVLQIATEGTMRLKDANDDGQLTAREFWEGGVDDAARHYVTAEESLADFEKLDVNGDERLDMDELQEWESGRYHSKEAMLELFRAADLDDDAHVSADELDIAKDAVLGSDAQYQIMEWLEHHQASEHEL